MIKSSNFTFARKSAQGQKKGRREMKKIWIKRLAAVSLMMAVGIGTGVPLWAQEEEMTGKTGGGDL